MRNITAINNRIVVRGETLCAGMERQGSPMNLPSGKEESEGELVAFDESPGFIAVGK